MNQQQHTLERHGWRRRWQHVMTVLIVLVLLCLGTGTFDIVSAQLPPSPPENIFLVSYFRSQQTAPLFDTVISVTNVREDESCPVTVVWQSNDGEMLCATASTIPANQTHHYCSSPSPQTSGVVQTCDMVCNTAGSNMEGHAFIQTAGRCGVRIGANAQIYSATFTRSVDGRIIGTENIGVHSVDVYRFDGLNITD